MLNKRGFFKVPFIKYRKTTFIVPVLFSILLSVFLSRAILLPEKTEIPERFLVDKGQTGMSDYAEGEILVKFAGHVGIEEVRDFAALLPAEIKKHYKAISRIMGHRYVLLKTDMKITPDMLQDLSKDPQVEFAAANDRIHICTEAPNDPRFEELWGLHNTGQTGGTADIDIDAPEAWERIGRTEPVIAAVIDTGINYNHPDLAANMWVNPGEIPGNGNDDDRNGYVDDIHGINGITCSGDPMDDKGHGTHSAGTIGAVGNNGLDSCGVNRNVKLIGAKALDVRGSGYSTDALACIEYIVDLKTAYDQNIVAINASFGGSAYNQALKDAIDAAGRAGIVFCASSGNEYTDDGYNNNDMIPFYPASYDCDNIISVTAVDHNGSQVYNFGASSVDLAAPGVDILSTKAWYRPLREDIFFDDMESGPGKWITGGTNNSWTITSDQEGFAKADYPVPSPPHFWSDRAGKDYLSDTDSWLMVNRDIDLSAYVGQDVFIGFGSAMAIEEIFDHARVEVSGSGGKDWLNKPLIDFSGFGLFWRTGYYYTIPDEVKTKHFRFRFRLKTDYQADAWGWLIDDVGIGTDITFACDLQKGTSMAAPYVTGAVTLIAALYPLETASQWKARILDNVVPLDSLAGICVTGGLLNLDLAAGDPPHITVTSPKTGRTFTIGKQVPVSWSSWGLTGDVSITLETPAGGHVYSVIDSTPYGEIPYEYTIPCSIPAGTYLIRVAQPGCGSGTSGNFAINAGACITVSRPGAGDIYYPGDELAIEWDSREITGDVSIFLMRSDLTPQTSITGAAPFDSSPYSYTIPAGLSAGSYYIGVKQAGTAFGRSADFSIKPSISSITVIKPAAGEIFTAGDNMEIEWFTSGIKGNVAITLRRTDGSAEYTVAASVPYDRVSRIYWIPAGVSPGTYVIEIRQGVVYGLSGSFTIN